MKTKSVSPGEKRHEKYVLVKPWPENRRHTGAFGNIFAKLWLRDEESLGKSKKTLVYRQ